MPDKATPTGKAHPLVNAGIERLQFMTAVVINPVPKAFEIIAKRFIFLANFSLLAASPKNYASTSLIFAS